MQKIEFEILIWNSQDTRVRVKRVYCNIPIIKDVDLNEGLENEVAEILEQERDFYNEWKVVEAWVVDE